ncbi:MAG: hypothetical protein A3G81_11990 [Betaproteobacteria bacterium RIFCSPLOWO2_12_FULL_65_14]|nr:MAG: hypothetical protein A3G81_11990 [Betaproteobacteria bacterium RIFCSPLOWO2_12_FULL_65_14]
MRAPARRPDASVPLPRPSFGEKGVERARPQQPPRFEDLRRAPAASAQPKRIERAGAQRALPGKPANDALPRQPQARGKGRSADSKR